MYEAFYGLAEPAFAITPDPRFLFLTRGHRDALAYLHYGIEQRKGFLALTGEVGTGKTLLIRTLLGQLPDDIETAIVMNARLNFKQLLYLALLDFNVQPAGKSKVELLLALQQFLLKLRDKSGNAVLIIDEAQNLSEESLEEFRLLSNFETANAKLIQIVLVGQPELRALLNRHSLRQLRQRIPGVHDLSRLPAESVREYVDFRLQVASKGKTTGLLTDRAIEELARVSGGIPRIVNQICDRALLVGYVKSAERIDLDHVREAARELDWVTEALPPSSSSLFRSS